MAQLANTYSTYDVVGTREELADVIFNISPEDTPVVSNAGRGNVENTFYEHQTDELAAASTTNAHIEGDDITTYDASVATARIGNYTQIFRKTAMVARTTEAVNRAGRGGEMAYQVTKRGRELRRDLEATICANQGAVAGDDSTARKTGSLLAYIKTNTSVGTNGANPSWGAIPTDTRSDGDQRTFTEALLKTVLQAVWTEGGNLEMAVMGAHNKGVASAFAGIAEQRWQVTGRSPGQAVIIGAADIYVSDWGELAFVPNRFSRARDVLILDSELYSIQTLDDLQAYEMAKTGDATKRMLVMECGLRVNQEKGIGIVADLTTS